MKKIATFIFVHEQDIILRYEEIEKFDYLPDVKYVLVGKNACDLVENNKKVIIARKLKNNIENHPKFTSFTGWYALWKNGLINSDYVSLLEYDVIVQQSFSKVTQSLVDQNIDFLGYVPMPVWAGCYLKYGQWTDRLFEVIKDVYQVEMKQFMEEFCAKNPNLNWSSTTNSTFSKNFFDKYMTWFEKIFNEMKDFEFAGHAHERSISIFCFFKKAKVILQSGLLEHLQLNSHGTSPLPKGRFNKYFCKLL
jgi:hypothetical protein